ncbi:MAG: hypothetical protein LBH25_12650 [Fibromonadaceae bacterium]|nr:hypothetical protein [Fibromonadaceae bacterium]
MIIERGELRAGNNPASLDSDNKELRTKNNLANIANHEEPSSDNKELRIRNNPESILNQGPDKINTERLKFIDDISRIILELKKQFPELAQNLEKARDNIPANMESSSAKNLTEIFNVIRQILNKLEITNRPEIQETVRNLINEVIKILQPSTEVPPENKLVLALLKNDFASANVAIKNIVEQNMPQTAQQPTQPAPQQIAQPVVPLQQPALPQIQHVQVLDLPQTTQQPAQPVPQQITQPVVPLQPLPQIQHAQVLDLPQTTQQPTQPVPQQIAQPQTQYTQILNLPQATQQQQNPFNSFQTFQVILNALQEIKTLGVPQELQNAPLKELEIIAQQKTGIEIPKNLVKNLSAIFNEKPVFAISNFTASNVKTENIATNHIRIEVAPSANPQPQQSGSAHIPAFEIPLPKNFPQAALQVFLQNPQNMQNPQVSQNMQIVQNPQSVQSSQSPQNMQNAQVSQSVQIVQNPQNTQSSQSPQNMQSPQVPQKQELAFSLYKIIVPQQSEAKFILQPWPASIHIPKEERAFWLKTELPLTPQILNLREEVLSFGKLPENPAVMKLFAESLHEMSLLSESGKPLEKEQINLLWRFVQTSSQTPQPATQPLPQPATHEQTSSLPQPTAQPLPQPATQITPHIPSHVMQTLLKYQPHENYEGELFKNLPEPLKKEILKELPAGKTWQPEALQQAIEKIKPNEEHRQILQNFKEQIQWTRIDQDTRQPQDRENVFYFMHNSELQKGRLKVKDERKGGGKKQQASSISFSIKTKTKNLGDVNADLTLNKRVLNIRMQDSIGNAGKAVENERETLAKELADIGISLGELLYGKTPRVRNLPIAKTKEENSGFDVRA